MRVVIDRFACDAADLSDRELAVALLREELQAERNLRGYDLTATRVYVVEVSSHGQLLSCSSREIGMFENPP